MPDRVTPQIAKIYGLPAPRGAIISNVEATVKVGGVTVESPAAKAGLKLNDVIVEFRGVSIKDNEDLVRRVASTPVGTTAPVKIYRDGRQMTLSVVIGRRPGRETIADTAAAPGSVNDLRKESLGVTVTSLSSQLALDADMDGAKGVLVQRVDPGSVADDAGLKVNDVIETINREPIDDKEDFKQALNRLKSGDPIVLLVRKKSLAPYPRIFISLNKP
jgi:serine protease Do